MSEYTYSDELMSDLHKDAYGCRPGITYRLYWQTLSADEKQAEWDQLISIMKAEQEAQRRYEEEAVVEYEHQILRNQVHGAPTREDAIRWILDSMELSPYDDAGFVCYKLGLPYQMEHEFVNILAEMHKEAA
jgi:hypothetical protein